MLPHAAKSLNNSDADILSECGWNTDACMSDTAASRFQLFSQREVCDVFRGRGYGLGQNCCEGKEKSHRLARDYPSIAVENKDVAPRSENVDQ